MVLVGRTDDRERFAGSALLELDLRGLGERGAKQSLDSGDSARRQADRAGAGTRPTHRAPGAGQ